MKMQFSKVSKIAKSEDIKILKPSLFFKYYISFTTKIKIETYNFI